MGNSRIFLVPAWGSYIIGYMQTRHEPAHESQTRMSGQKCILVAEDNEDDLVLLRLGFGKAGLSHKLAHAWNGEVALSYLAGEPPFSDRDQHPFPDLLLLDLKMPRLDGFGLLHLLRSHPELNALPVVVLSSSLLREDAQKAKSLGAREVLSKPTDIQEYRDMLLDLHQRWLGPAIPHIANSPKRMRIVLRNFQTGAYFQTATRWTKDQKAALDFEDHEAAIRVARELRLQNIELCHVGEDGEPILGTRLEIDP
jgi:CheY-like chemotaxis protein